MSANVQHLLHECLEAHTAQRNAAQHRLDDELRAGTPDKKKLARHQRAIMFAEKQIETTRAALARAEAGTIPEVG